MEKIKSFKFSNFLNILKCCLVAIVVTLVGIILFAVVLKFVDVSSTMISYINDIIKAIALFVMILCIKRSNGDRLMIKAIIGGVVYAVLSFIIFSILNGGFVFNMSVVYDLLFVVAVSIIATVIINLTNRKNW